MANPVNYNFNPRSQVYQKNILCGADEITPSDFSETKMIMNQAGFHNSSNQKTQFIKVNYSNQSNNINNNNQFQNNGFTQQNNFSPQETNNNQEQNQFQNQMNVEANVNINNNITSDMNNMNYNNMNANNMNNQNNMNMYNTNNNINNVGIDGINIYNMNGNNFQTPNDFQNNFQNNEINTNNCQQNMPYNQNDQNPQNMQNMIYNQNPQNMQNMMYNQSPQNIQNPQNMQNMMYNQNPQNIQNPQNMQNMTYNQNTQDMNCNQNMQNMNAFNQQPKNQYNVYQQMQNCGPYNYMIQQNNSNQSITSLKELNFVPKIGLDNLGQTCYMNSVLQCFSNLKHITNYFLNPAKQKKVKDHMLMVGQKEDSLLCLAYKELIDHLWKGTPNQFYSPINFKRRLEKLNPLFASNTAGDSKDFANFLIMRLHEELNLIETNTSVQINLNTENIKVDPLNQKQVFDAFMRELYQNNYSVISYNFYGITQGQFECQRCKMKLSQKGINLSPIKYNYESFFYLEFPLDEVRKHVAEKNNQMAFYQNIDKVDINDCFSYFSKMGSIVGYCEKCKIDNAKINTKNDIFNPPLILMLIFNRGKGIQYKIKIDFPQILYISQMTQISQTVNNYNNAYYDLKGVVKHFGESSSYGHFIAYCRPPVQNFENQWYCYNDKTVVEANSWDDIVNKGDTYILFYELKKNK